jgi:serine/threonine protein phosphatase PrpC
MNEMDPHSTAVMLLLQPGRVTWGHCGDSRLYHFRGKELVRRSVDHSYVEHLIATGKITPGQALNHPNRNVLLASLGGQDDPKITIDATDSLLAGDAFVLCSDGLWAYFDDAEMGALVADNSARQACEQLIEKARERAKGGGDNLSLAIIKLVEALPSKPKPPPGFVPRLPE